MNIRMIFKSLILFLILATCQTAFCYSLSDDELHKIIINKINSEAKEALGNMEYKIRLQGALSDVITNDLTAPTVEISELSEFSPTAYRRVTVKDSKGNIVKTFPLNVKILIYDNVLVASEPVAFAKELNNSNTRLEKREISRYFDKTLTYLPENLIAARGIAQGNIILNNYVKQKPIINKNQNVDIVFEGKNVQITLKGKALKEGARGEIIPVRSDAYNKTYSAMVETNTKVVVGI